MKNETDNINSSESTAKNTDNRKIKDESIDATENESQSIDNSESITGYIHSIETLGALDGPGMRTVIFFSGCPMRCKYCHNPDTWAYAQGEKRYAKELAEFCGRYASYHGDGGGVTLSGGEPLLQQAFCLQLIELLHKKNIHVAIDTGGSIFAPEVLSAADLTILDIKHTNAHMFKELTGMDNSNLLKTLEYIKANKLKFWVRQVIVPDITDSESQVTELKSMAAGAERVELLAYHDMGKHKWEKLGLTYGLQCEPPSKEKMDYLNSIIHQKIKTQL